MTLVRTACKSQAFEEESSRLAWGIVWAYETNGKARVRKGSRRSLAGKGCAVEHEDQQQDGAADF